MCALSYFLNRIMYVVMGVIHIFFLKFFHDLPALWRSGLQTMTPREIFSKSILSLPPQVKCKYRWGAVGNLAEAAERV